MSPDPEDSSEDQYGRQDDRPPDVRRARLPRGCYKELKTNRAILLVEGLAVACGGLNGRLAPDA